MRAGLISMVGIAALMAVNSAAVAAPVASTNLASLSKARAGKHLKKGEHLAGAALVLVVVAGAAAVAGVVAAADGGSSKSN